MSARPVGSSKALHSVPSTEAWTSTADTMLFAQIAMASSMAQNNGKLDCDQVGSYPAHCSTTGCISSSGRVLQCPNST